MPTRHAVWSSPRRGHGRICGRWSRGWARIGAWNGTRAASVRLRSWAASSSLAYVVGCRRAPHRPRDRRHGRVVPGRRGRRPRAPAGAASALAGDPGRADDRLRARERHRRASDRCLHPARARRLGGGRSRRLAGGAVPRRTPARRQRRLATVRDRGRGCGRGRGARLADYAAIARGLLLPDDPRPGRALPRRLGDAARAAGPAQPPVLEPDAWTHAASSSSRRASPWRRPPCSPWPRGT